jgi:septum formation protein
MTVVRLVLASSSPRRAELLRAAGYTFEVLAVDIDEAVSPGEEPAAYVRRLAIEKSAGAHELLSAGLGPRIRPPGPTSRSGGAHAEPEGLVVLGADTTVVVDGEILGKPRDGADSERMLRRLAGRRHEVMTGISLRRTDIELGGVETTIVDFMTLSEAGVAWYHASGEGMDKAGGYAIQGLASRFITRIDGSYSNVVGLPVSLVFRFLERLASAG